MSNFDRVLSNTNEICAEYFRSRTKSKSRSRSRSHSFSPPPTTGENGKPTMEEPKEDEEEAKRREEEINALPPYFPALQVCYY